MTEDELRPFLAGMYEMLRRQQETLFRIQRVALAMRQALRDLNPDFETAYARYFEAEQSGPSEIIRKLRSTE
jgi:hypothetical protein